MLDKMNTELKVASQEIKRLRKIGEISDIEWAYLHNSIECLLDQASTFSKFSYRLLKNVKEIQTNS